MLASMAAQVPHHQIERAAYLLHPWVTDALDGATIAATIAIALFTIQYTLSAPWWRDKVGQTFAIKDLFLLGILVPSCLVLIWHNLLTVYQSVAISFSVLVGITLVMAWRMIVFWRIRRPSLDLFRTWGMLLYRAWLRVRRR